MSVRPPMVESVMKAIAFEWGLVWGSRGVDYEGLEAAARAAIAALREPTQQMICAALDDHDKQYGTSFASDNGGVRGE